MKKKELGKGFTHVYTGNGKGKTTAAIGLAVRAAGAGLKVYILQIMKNFPYSELEILNSLSPQIRLEKVGGDEFVLQKRPPNEREKKGVKEKLEKVKRLMLSKEFDIFIFDEICVANYFKLVDTEKILDIIEQKPYGVEIVLTGRYCPEVVIEKADLVTEMKEIKHYYQQGILSRRGIDS